MSKVEWNREYQSKVTVEKGYYDSGILCVEVPFVNGKRHGIIRWYNKEGILEREVPFVNDRGQPNLTKLELLVLFGEEKRNV